MACASVYQNLGGNTVSNIPVKMGFPLSSGCARDNTAGAIPYVFNYHGFFLVNGSAPVNRVMTAGITNMGAFFKNVNGCYQSRYGRLKGATCV